MLQEYSGNYPKLGSLVSSSLLRPHWNWAISKLNQLLRVTQDTNICLNIYLFFFSLSSFLKLCSVKQTCLQLEAVLKQQEKHMIFFHATSTLSEGLGFLSSTRNKWSYTHVLLTAVFFLDLRSIVLDELGETRHLTCYVNPCPCSIADFPSLLQSKKLTTPLENSS